MPLKRLKKARRKVLLLLLAVTLAFAPAAFASGQLCTMAEHMMHTAHVISMGDPLQDLHPGLNMGDMGEPGHQMSKKCGAGYLCDGNCSNCAPASVGVTSQYTDPPLASCLSDLFVFADPIGAVVPTETPPPNRINI